MFVILLCSVVYAETCTRHPVVIIPGIMASVLEAKIDIPDNVDFCDRGLDCDRNKDWFTLWVNLLDGIPYINDCYLAYLQCVYNSTSGLMNNVEGVQIRAPDFGSTYAVDYICPTIILKQFSKAFHEIIKGLESVGYKDGYDLLGAPYDWRYYHMDDYYENVKQLIITAYENTNEKIVLLSHSMGGLTTYILLDKLGKEFCDKYILRWVAMSTPFIGTNLANDVLLTGYSMGFPVSKSKIKELARTLETIGMMAPNNDYWDTEDVLVDMTSTGKEYRANDQLELFKTMPELDPFGEEAYEKSFKPYLKKYNAQVPFGVEMHCGITSGLETVKKITFESDIDSKYTKQYGDGDEEVPLASLEFCKQMTQNFTNLGKYNHNKMLSKKVTVEYVQALVCD
ncbi:1-O-acylceramide synthase [Entamoeba marina]